MAEEKEPIPIGENWFSSYPPYQHHKSDHCGNQQERVGGFRPGKSTFVDWNAVFTRLPNSFTLKQFTSRSEAKGKSPAYLRHIAATWVKRGKTKRVRLGKYQKVEQKKLRAA
jgi:hypothetical protein